jgi:hypothetical protein
MGEEVAIESLEKDKEERPAENGREMEGDNTL